MNPFVLFALLCPLVVVAAVFLAVEILKRRMGGPDPRHPSQYEPCPCWTCQTAAAEDPLFVGVVVRQTAAAGPLLIGMVVCEFCGNKRCPHATHHDLACTGSNDPGQVGSRYA